MLEIYAGSNALKTIQEQGFKQELFTSMLGASGGPKWFTLFGLDKYLFGEFFKDRTTDLNLVGSSAGAFRFAALSQQDPVAAITRLATYYSETVYSKNANAKEITTKARELLSAVYGKDGISQIINNPLFKAHFIVARCHGLTSYETKPLQLVGLLTSMLLNKVNRGLLRHQYQRVIFHHPTSQLSIDDQYNFNNVYQPLNQENLADALLASGSIPLVMEGIKDIKGCNKGMYRDGGIIDYHFDVNLTPNNGLILYPHFNAKPKAGWFDKNSSREVNKANYENTVMIVPSDKFINQLPYQKIPDRKDFTQMDATTRINYWREVLLATEQLADEFDQLIHSPELLARKMKAF
ncbi:patatin-like phospholipase family protein [Thalassotalea profundi]|uniref:PNPLA domain-containing protein n=1 Tax=Thalassotalea profundi TaxID=2036687 RepID=A0ABQ3IAY9_9GAMM|nr:patatin-like phospholipase family protein [Thalassotalea profundi]GHE77405.1 hypothetical protein GCM10011501_01180 [Thalassotalea profundi]